MIRSYRWIPSSRNVDKALNLNISELIAKEVKAVYSHLAEDYALYLTIGLITALSTIFIFAADYGTNFAPFSYLSQLKALLPISLIVYFGFNFIALMLRREPRPLLYLWNNINSMYGHRARIISALFLLSAVSIFASNFSTVKALIPLVHPFEYDALFHSIDLQLFSGIEPWAFVHSLVPSPYFTLTLNLFYNIWLLLVWVTLCYFALCSNRTHRFRFILSWLLSWTIIGNILALLMSSAGPAFVAKLDPSNLIYQDLITLLMDHDTWLKNNDLFGIWALNTQELLWEAYATDRDMLGSGISAMPSMHVSMAVLMALSANMVNKKLGLVMWAYAFAIYIGSFALGWHYAIDGLVSAPITLMIWLGVGRFVARLENKQLANQPSALIP